MTELPSQFLTRKQAAQFLNLQPQTLAKWSCIGAQNIPVVRFGRAVRYELKDLQDYAKRSKATPRVGRLCHP
jgi:hypothetical protein